MTTRIYVCGVIPDIQKGHHQGWPIMKVKEKA